MLENKKNKVAPLQHGDATTQTCQKALAETCKALKAFSFYPEGHPLREQLLQRAYQSVTNLAKEGRVSLVVQRDGFSFADQQAAIDNTPMTKALAQELFARELQRLSFLPELTLVEFTRFLSLLTISPQKISEAGGVAGMMTKEGIKTIIVNEIDISAVFTRKPVADAADNPVANGTGLVEEHEPDTVRSKGSLSDHLNELSIEELIAMMSSEMDDDKYRHLARVLLAKARPLNLEGNFDRLFMVLIAMSEQIADVTGSPARSECSLMVLQQLSLGEMTEHLLDHLKDEDFAHKETLYVMLNQLGAEVVPAVIRRLVSVGSKLSKKPLMAAVVRIGPPAQPALIGLLKDGRWQVVHTAVTILGEMGNRDAVKALVLTVSHFDNRVRMETIRSLARIGGMEATALLVGLLQDDNQAIGIQAITWLGNSRNQAALQPLLQLVMKGDFLGKSQPLKKEALVAISRIGDRRALDPLFSLVKKRYWIVPNRWHELKLLAIEAIGKLGGESARAFLQSVSARSGRLAPASHAALEFMTQRNADNHE